MDDVTKLIEYFLTTPHSVDSLDSVLDAVNISEENLLQLLELDRCKDYFQLLRPSKNTKKPKSKKIALALDLFCCTHYGNQCRNHSCPFLHLCPYNVRPMHTRCTNKQCGFVHEILKDAHNRKIIDSRGLGFLPNNVLQELTRASANPDRSFWVCTDHGKKGGCPKKNQCDKLHYCYFELTNACTKQHCQHELNDACLAYFRHKELAEQDSNDVLEIFRKVLRQRKPDYANTLSLPHHPGSTVFPSANGPDNRRDRESASCASASSVVRKPSANQPSRRVPSNSNRMHPLLPSTTTGENDDESKSRSIHPAPLTASSKDIFFSGMYDPNELAATEHYLSEKIACPIKLILMKQIESKIKEQKSSHPPTAPTYYYCPTQKSSDIFALLHWQNGQDQSTTPLTVYASIRDAHDAAQQDPETNQFCLLSVQLLQSGVINGNFLPENRLQLTDSSTMRFDCMWIYMYNFQDI